MMLWLGRGIGECVRALLLHVRHGAPFLLQLPGLLSSILNLRPPSDLTPHMEAAARVAERPFFDIYLFFFGFGG